MNKKGKVNGKIYDVIDMDEYKAHPDIYNNSFTAIEKEGLLYPIRNNNLAPGFFVKNQVMGVYVQPSSIEDRDMYSAENVIDFSSATNMKEIIEKKAQYKDLEREILCDADNIFKPVIRDNDAPMMKALKEAVIEKNIDINKYETRFGSTFNNDKRIFNNSSITLNKLISTADALDMKVTVSIEDKNDDVPNPIGKVITVDLIGGGENE